MFHGVALVDSKIPLEDTTNQKASLCLEDAVIQTHLQKRNELD